MNNKFHHIKYLALNPIILAGKSQSQKKMLKLCGLSTYNEIFVFPTLNRGGKFLLKFDVAGPNSFDEVFTNIIVGI